MEQLKQLFQKLYSKYQQRKSYFQATVEKWKQKGWDDVYPKGKQSLEDAERLIQELQQSFATGQVDEAVTKERLKRFKKIYKELHESTKPAWRQWLEAVFIALTLAILLRHTIFSPYHVPTGSAEPNILVGDRIWGNKMAYYLSNIKRGDLVIFDDPRPVYDVPSNFVQELWQRYIGFPVPMLGLPAGPINVVKRVFAIPGDTIEGKIEDGKTVLYLNGKKVDEPYLNMFPLIGAKRETGFLGFSHVGPFAVPDFLRKKMKTDLRYTFDPSTSLEEQPYYYLHENEIRRRDNNEPVLYQPRSPSYTMRINEREFLSIDAFGPITLPKDYYWVMGDSRKNSDDSRGWGPLHRKYIHGRASFILFSIDSEEPFWLFALLKHPIDFWTKYLRWNRFLKSLPSVASVPAAAVEPKAEEEQQPARLIPIEHTVIEPEQHEEAPQLETPASEVSPEEDLNAYIR